MAELKPCPCGKIHEINSQMTAGCHFVHWIYCQETDNYVNANSKEEVIKMWNEKMEEIEKQKQIDSCPFCKGQGVLLSSEYDYADHGYISAKVDYSYYVECSKCEVRTAMYDTPDQAIDAWNKRS